MERDEAGFLERCAEARKLAFSFREPLIVHHYDADGLSAGALVAAAFLEEGKKFRRDCIKKLDDIAIERYMREPEVIFADLGGACSSTAFAGTSAFATISTFAAG